MKDSNASAAWSERQRVVVLTFADADRAKAWDDAGQPVCLSCDCATVDEPKP